MFRVFVLFIYYKIFVPALEPDLQNMTIAKALIRAVIMGPPGAGKGTIAKRIVKDFGLTHLASGDILRKQVSAATSVGLQAQKYIASGALVPDEVMLKLVLGELNSKY